MASRVQIEDVYRHRYSSFCHGAAAILGDYGLAHDAVQDGFAHALARSNSFRGGSLEAWVWAIVVSRAYDELRRRKRSLKLQLEDGLISSEQDSELAEAIRRLPERRRLVVFLRYFADLPYPAIAELCRISEGTVAATLSQAHAELRSILQPEGVQP